MKKIRMNKKMLIFGSVAVLASAIGTGVSTWSYAGSSTNSIGGG